jgi:hypothetical protein
VAVLEYLLDFDIGGNPGDRYNVKLIQPARPGLQR